MIGRAPRVAFWPHSGGPPWARLGRTLKTVDKFLIRAFGGVIFGHNIHMAFSDSSLWQQCVDRLAQELPEQQFNTWIKPLQGDLSEDGQRLTLWVGNRFKLDWIRAQYSAKIHQLMHELHGQSVELEFALTSKESTAKTVISRPILDAELAQPVFVSQDDGESQGFRSRLNVSLTFDSLVEGSANRMARAAAMHVAKIGRAHV